MGSVPNNTLSKQGILRIRPYRPEDREQVLRIFKQGMLGLSLVGCQDFIRTRRSLQLLACALPVATLSLTPRKCAVTTKLVAALGAAVAVPLATYALVRRAMWSYVSKSLAEDMSCIDTFYSSTGAGHGSVFWVAELVEGTSTASAGTAPGLVSSASRAQLQSIDSTSEPRVSSSGPAPPAPAIDSSKDNNASADPGLLEGEDAEEEPEEQQQEEELVTPEFAGSSLANGAAAADPATSSDDEVRNLVAGLVAAAIAKFETGSTNSPVAPKAVAEANAKKPALAEKPVPKKAFKGVALQQPESSASTSTISATPALTRLESVPAPDTPASVPEVRSQWSYANLNPAAALRSISAVASRFRLANDSFTSSAPSVTASQPSASAASFRAPAATAPRSVIVGHVALERKTWQVAELRRMSVARRYRGQGMARKLLEAVVQHARDNQFREVILETSSLQEPAQKLYESAGFVVAKEVDWEGIKVITYKLDLIKKK